MNSEYLIDDNTKICIQNVIGTVMTEKIKTYKERYGCEIEPTLVLKGLSYLLLKQPYNPLLWNLYGTCRFLRSYKPKSFMQREVRIQDYYPEHDHWLSGNFSDVRDIITIDNMDKPNPNSVLVTLYSPGIQDLTLLESMVEKQTMYIIPVEWVKCIAMCDDGFVLLPFEFCCREVLVRSSTQMVRCQSMKLEPQYLVDETFFHAGCGLCNSGESLVEVFAGLPLHIGIRNLMKMIDRYDFMNPAEMLYALGRYEPVLPYFTQDGKSVLYKGSELKKYLAHILVCKVCHKYMLSFLTMLDQSVKNHPYPEHTSVSKDRLNDAGIPIFEYVLDADFDVLRSKAFYGVSNVLGEDICALVVKFMNDNQILCVVT